MTLTIPIIGIIIIILLIASLCAFVHFTGRSDQARTHLKTKADKERRRP